MLRATLGVHPHDAASLDADALGELRRLASHPSLVVWCGNNEMEWGAWDWGYDRVGAILPDHGLFHVILPRLLQQEDPTRYYQPSSPFSPGTVHPNADHVGDQHPWQVGFANGDFRDYRKMTCRFPNEGGILGPTALPTMLACLPDGQRRLHSFAWDVHENSVDSSSDGNHDNRKNQDSETQKECDLAGEINDLVDQSGIHIHEQRNMAPDFI